jgi:hypothetical protein
MATHDDDYLDIFGVDIPEPVEIEVDDELQSKLYSLSLYERIVRLEKPTDEVIEKEILETVDSQVSVTSLTYSEDSFDELQAATGDIKDIVTYEVEEMVVKVPIFKKPRDLLNWSKVLDHHSTRITSIANDLDALRRDKAVSEKLTQLHKTSQRIEYKSKDKSVRDSVMTTVYVSLAERWIYDKIGSVAYHFRTLRGIIDEVTDGLWVNKLSDKRGQHLLNRLGVRRVAIRRRYKFDANQTGHLIKKIFSCQPDVRANAQLNIGAKLDQKLFDEVQNNCAKVLEHIVSEAQLSQEEILFLVFPRHEKTDDRMCLSCEVAINLGNVVYHARCKTVQWLERHARFSYNADEQSIHASQMVYLDADTRSRLTNILDMHAQLKRDIVQKTPTQTKYWRRADDGTLKPQIIRSQREDELVGSYAWRKARGLSI